ncbi:unnamed protein product [Blepharisma stoltei]|uniref:Uncharacterized protein n=1 Tax=Blepharisma stoltei TaxID=1481888 RepID=A0AAU9J4Y4_9CILI|nr:unnamed protein product [Blepharisma stoltei]
MTEEQKSKNQENFSPKGGNQPIQNPKQAVIVTDKIVKIPVSETKIPNYPLFVYVFPTDGNNQLENEEEEPQENPENAEALQLNLDPNIVDLWCCKMNKKTFLLLLIFGIIFAIGVIAYNVGKARN